MQGLIVADPLREQQSLDAVDVLDPLGGQRLALTADAAPILRVRRGRPDHRTHPRLTALVGQQRAHQSLTIDLVGLGPAAAAGDRNRGGIHDVALDPLALQHAMDPEPIKTRLLNQR